MSQKNIKISVVIASYNRFDALLKAIQSVQEQTHKLIEIIVVNDQSSDSSYYDSSLRPKNIIWIDLDKSSREVTGFPCLGYVKNHGIAVATGEYVASLDDDDYWFPQKLEVQLRIMLKKNSHFSATESYIGDGVYDSSKQYMLFNRHYHRKLCKHFSKTHKKGWRRGLLPEYFDKSIISENNFIIHSSVMVTKKLLDKVGRYQDLPMAEEDIDLWLRILDHTDCLHIDKPLMYYDKRITDPNDQKNYAELMGKKFIKYDLVDFFYKLF